MPSNLMPYAMGCYMFSRRGAFESNGKKGLVSALCSRTFIEFPNYSLSFPRTDRLCCMAHLARHLLRPRRRLAKRGFTSAGILRQPL